MTFVLGDGQMPDALRRIRSLASRIVRLMSMSSNGEFMRAPTRMASGSSW